MLNVHGSPSQNDGQQCRCRQPRDRTSLHYVRVTLIPSQRTISFHASLNRHSIVGLTKDYAQPSTDHQYRHSRRAEALARKKQKTEASGTARRWPKQGVGRPGGGGGMETPGWEPEGSVSRGGQSARDKTVFHSAFAYLSWEHSKRRSRMSR
jgi:hypothetical protein